VDSDGLQGGKPGEAGGACQPGEELVTVLRQEVGQMDLDGKENLFLKI